LLAVLGGFVAGLLRAWYNGRVFAIPDLRTVWLVFVAFIPQWIVFYLPLTRRLASDEVAAAALLVSQTLLLIFAWFNRQLFAFWVLGLGLLLNLCVISLNGGLMPISPETLSKMGIDLAAHALQVGERFGGSKDVLLPPAQTRFVWLSDRFLLPGWFPYSVAFSLGDILIAVGAFWLLWASGGSKISQASLSH